MPHKRQHQFEPVAAGAIAVLNATQRSGRQISQRLNLPAPPGVETVVNQQRSLLQRASELLPLNMLATGRLPQPPVPGGQGAMGFPNPQQFLPGGQGAGGVPNPQQFFPSGQQTGMTGRRTRPSRASSGSNGGASKTEKSSSSSRNAEESRS